MALAWPLVQGGSHGEGVQSVPTWSRPEKHVVAVDGIFGLLIRGALEGSHAAHRLAADRI